MDKTRLPEFEAGAALVVIQAVLGYQDNKACAVCRSTEAPAAAGPVLAWMACQVCGVCFHDACYWRSVVSPEEYFYWREYGVLDLFLCHGCRS